MRTGVNEFLDRVTRHIKNNGRVQVTRAQVGEVWKGIAVELGVTLGSMLRWMVIQREKDLLP